MQQLKVKKITIYQIKIPFSVQVTHNLAARKESSGFLVEIEDVSGLKGYGEGTPRKYVTGEGIEETKSELKKIGSHFIGHGFNGYGSFLGLLEEYSNNFLHSPSAYCAYEIALFDLYAKKHSVPLWKLLSDTPVQNEIFYSSILPILPQKNRLAILELTKKYKISQIKAKASNTISETIEVISEAKHILGREANIRIDANGAFSAAEAVKLANSITERGLFISVLEQPVAKEDFQGLKEVEDKTGIPVIADESFCNERDLNTIIEKKICKGLNVRISKCGGLLKSKAFVEKAQEAGLFCQLGCHVGETSVLSAAGRHLAVACGPFKFIEGCYSKFLLKDDLVEKPLEFGLFGKASIPMEPGLGIKVNQSAIERCCKKIDEITM